jgi:hypothetical protein
MVNVVDILDQNYALIAVESSNNRIEIVCEEED